MKDLSERELELMADSQWSRVDTLAPGAAPTAEELDVLESFWNPYFHTLRDWVPLASIVDRETQKLTSLHNSPAAGSLVCARLKALMELGFIGDVNVVREDGSPTSESLWLTSKGSTHFATGIPNILKRPATFARRHLSLFQLAAIIVTVVLAVATFVGRVVGWVG